MRRIVLAGLGAAMALVGRTGLPVNDGRTMVIRSRKEGDPKLAWSFAPKEPVPKQHARAQPRGMHHVKNPRVLTRLNRPRRGRD